MQSQYGSPSQAAAPALEYVGVGRRLLALVIDGIILLIVGWIIIWTSPTKQRLGDCVAHTVVIRRC